MKINVFFSACLMVFSATCFAQQNPNESVKQQLVSDWERAKAYTKEYLDAYTLSLHDALPIYRKSVV